VPAAGGQPNAAATVATGRARPSSSALSNLNLTLPVTRRPRNLALITGISLAVPVLVMVIDEHSESIPHLVSGSPSHRDGRPARIKLVQRSRQASSLASCGRGPGRRHTETVTRMMWPLRLARAARAGAGWPGPGGQPE
jgi:hypothetical protein